MPDSAAFHQGLHCLLRQNQSSEKEVYFFFFLEIITCIPSIYKMARPDITVSSFMEISIVLKRVKQ